MELLLVALLGIGAWFYFKGQHPATAVTNVPVDAIQLLAFTPFNLKSGPLTALYIAPKGLTPQMVTDLLQTGVNPKFSMMVPPVLRKTVPIPGPSIVPASADLWEVKGNWTGGDAISVTPDFLLKQVIKGGIPVPGIPANRQLAAILYAAAMSPALTPDTPLWPIAAVSPFALPTASSGAYIQGYHRYSGRYWPKY